MQHFRAARGGLLSIVSQNPEKSLPGAPKSSTIKKQKTGTLITNKIPQGHFHKQSRDVIKKAIEKLTEMCPITSRLRTDGDRDVLERRHKDFVHLHNAQLDSPTPLTLEQVVAEVHRREAARVAEVKRIGGKSNEAVEKLKMGEVQKRAYT